MDSKLRQMVSDEFKPENITAAKMKATLDHYGYQGDDLAKYIALLLQSAYATGYVDAELEAPQKNEEAEIPPTPSPVRFKPVSYVEGTRRSK